MTVYHWGPSGSIVAASCALRCAPPLRVRDIHRVHVLWDHRRRCMARDLWSANLGGASRAQCDRHRDRVCDQPLGNPAARSTRSWRSCRKVVLRRSYCLRDHRRHCACDGAQTTNRPRCDASSWAGGDRRARATRLSRWSSDGQPAPSARARPCAYVAHRAPDETRGCVTPGAVSPAAERHDTMGEASGRP